MDRQRETCKMDKEQRRVRKRVQESWAAWWGNVLGVSAVTLISNTPLESQTERNVLREDDGYTEMQM